MAASIYMILGRIILLLEGEKYALVKQRWLTKLFVCGDLLSILLQGAGGGLMAAGESLLETGENVIIGGLFVQLVVFGGFMIVAGVFHYRMTQQPTTKASDPEIRWRMHIFTLYVTGGIIWGRSLFRVVEFIEGNDGHLMRSEGWVFGFDSVPMVIVVLWMNWFHPSEIGLLLRGEGPIKNGLELVKGNPIHRERSTTMESISSEYEMAGQASRRV
ncbi:hypothetical protein CEP52_009403 [Fusarium oligoseptatum]|uniref:Uncharacterized protein n=1 Tax=Fusarium oligoseptatum TaxID=2604345 RepID=A0A428TDB9_9HYPO|nr:hypothetical protein CEP52_009403 [Fusarium oligoseptatum]